MTAVEFDLFEIMRTTRSMRRLKTDPVPDALLHRILESGTYAASGGNMQAWRFLVIRDPKVKEAAGAWCRKAWHEVVAPRYRSGEPAPGTSPERFSRMLAAAEYLADHIHEAPVWIVPCLAGPRQPGSGSSIYPAVQNMLLSTRALGLGTTLTTLYLIHEKEAESAMGIPDSHHSYAILPIGYPLGKFGPVRLHHCLMLSTTKPGADPGLGHEEACRAETVGQLWERRRVTASGGRDLMGQITSDRRGGPARADRRCVSRKHL